MIDTQKEYARRQQIPLYWHNKSSDLRAAAGSVWYCMEQSRKVCIAEELNLPKGFDIEVAAWPVYRMLCGLSLELIYKAVIVAKNEQPNNTRNLAELATTAGIGLDKNMRGVLDLLTEGILWEGKYPSPNKIGHANIEKFSTLHKEKLFVRTMLGSSEIFTPRIPNPLSWEEFSIIWNFGNRAYWEKIDSSI